jgi:predicted nucleic acid-binding protein
MRLCRVFGCELAGIQPLEVNEEITVLAHTLMKEAGLPKRATTDALHIATAAVRGMAYLLTWNCTHIANPAL